MEKQTCNFCSRSGIFFYPVRYAVACPAGVAGVPGLPENFRVERGPQDISPAKYALRSLRSGYFYVYDEKRKKLSAYIVQPTGLLVQFDHEYEPGKPTAGGTESCSNPMRMIVPNCFCVDHSESDKVGRIWCGWSNTFWTKRLRSMVSDGAWRKLHMQCIDVPALLKGSTAHAGEFNAVAESIPHLNSSDKAFKAAFGFSGASADIESRRRHLRTRLAGIFPKSSAVGKGFVIAVNDPVGIANDMSELTLPTDYAGFDESVHRGSVCLNLLESLEAGVRDKARLNAEQRHVLGPKPNLEFFVIRGVAVAKEERNIFHKSEAERGKAIQEEVEKAWNEVVFEDGRSLLETVQIKNFPVTYASALRKFESKAARLATLHRDWLKADQLSEWMQGVHDDQDIRSGYAYRESLAQCIGHGASTSQCKELLHAWLSAESVSETRNLLSRAILFNQTQLVNATSPHMKLSDFPTEGILNLYKRALETVSKGEEAKLIDRLILTIANVLIEVLRHTTSALVRNKVTICLALVGRVVIRTAAKTKQDLLDWVLKAAKITSRSSTPFAQSAGTEIFSSASTITTRRGDSRKVFILEIDVDSKGLGTDQFIKGNGEVKIPYLDAERAGGGASDFRLGLVTAIVQIVALYFALNDLEENNRFNRVETQAKAVGAGLSVLMTATETVGSTVTKSVGHPLSLYLLEHWKVTSATWGRVAGLAKVTGALAGLVGAFFDFQKAHIAVSKGRYGTAFTYTVSGVVGTGLVALAFTTIPALWILLLGAIACALILPYLNRAELRTWISRCYFGADLDKYLSAEEELKCFNAAVGG